MRPCGVVHPHESVMSVSCAPTHAISNPALGRIHGHTLMRMWVCRCVSGRIMGEHMCEWALRHAIMGAHDKRVYTSGCT